jgi:hypothetical protein
MVAGSLVGLTGLVLAPISAGADAVAPTGRATASALTVNVSPQALLAVPPQLVSALDQLSGQNILGISTTDLVTTLKSALTQTTTLNVDYADAQAILDALAHDLTGGQATSTAVRIQLQGLDQVLTDLKTFLNDLVGQVSTQLQPIISSLTQQLGPGNNLVQQLSQLTGLPLDVQGLLGSLGSELNGVNIDKTLSVTLDQQPQRVDLLTLPGPLSLSLAPFEAASLSSRGVQQYGNAAQVSSPQSTAFNTTTALSLLNQLGLPAIDLGNLSQTVSSLLSTVTQQLNSLNVGGAAVVGATCSTLSSALGPLGTTIGGACASATSNASQAVTTLTTSLSQLQQVLGNLNGILANLGPLNNVLAALPSLQLNGLIQTSGLTSTALSQPLNNGVNVLSTTKLVDLQVLPLSGTLANLLQATAGTALLEVKGVTAHAGAFVNGVDATPPSGDSGLTEIDVLGKPVITTDSLIPQGTSKTISVPTPLGTLALVVSRGVPQVVNNSVAHKTIDVAALDIQLNWTPTGTNAQSPLPLLGPGGSIVDLCAGCVQVDAAMSPQAVVPPAAAAVPANPSLPKTGMLGPAGFAAAGLLALLALPARFAARRRAE